jgi:hypothetical protein
MASGLINEKKLKNQVCSPKLAEKLKELGISQNSLFYYLAQDYSPFDYELRVKDSFDEIYYKYAISTFTSTELMEILPRRITLKENEPFNNFGLRIEKSLIVLDNNKIITTYFCNYYCDTTEVAGEDAWFARTLLNPNIYDQKFPDSLAKILIKLKEEGYI